MRRRITFADRAEAGRLLAERLATLELQAPLVLALPRGGVPVAAEIARALAAPLDVAFVRKIGAPGQPELAIGAIADGGEPEIVLNRKLVRSARSERGLHHGGSRPRARHHRAAPARLREPAPGGRAHGPCGDRRRRRGGDRHDHAGSAAPREAPQPGSPHCRGAHRLARGRRPRSSARPTPWCSSAPRAASARSAPSTTTSAKCRTRRWRRCSGLRRWRRCQTLRV